MTDVAKFLDALRRQQEKYRLMVGVAEEQKRFLEASDVDGLMTLVERKRALMADIDAFEKELAEGKAKWPELRSELDPATLQEVEGAVGETRRLLETLVRLEEEGRLIMERQRDSTAEELKGLMTKKKARGAYGAPGGGGDARFYDKKD